MKLKWAEKDPNEGAFLRGKQRLLLLAISVLFVFFFGAVDFLVVHLATTMAASEGRDGDKHEHGSDH
jgi:hypothetical protein